MADAMAPDSALLNAPLAAAGDALADTMTDAMAAAAAADPGTVAAMDHAAAAVADAIAVDPVLMDAPVASDAAAIAGAAIDAVKEAAADANIVLDAAEPAAAAGLDHFAASVASDLPWWAWPASIRTPLEAVCIAYYAVILATLLPLSAFPPLRALLHHGKLLVPASTRATSPPAVRRVVRRRRPRSRSRLTTAERLAGDATGHLTTTTDTDDGISDSSVASTISRAPTTTIDEVAPLLPALPAQHAGTGTATATTATLPAARVLPGPSASSASAYMSSRITPLPLGPEHPHDPPSTPRITTRDWFHTLISLHVPKAWFTHFYIVAVSMTITLWLVTSPSWPLALYAMHASRRYWEQNAFFASTESKMHTGHYLLGLSFYTVTPLALALAVMDARLDGSYSAPGWLLTFAFAGCNLSQLMHHYFLSVMPKPTPTPPSRTPSVSTPAISSPLATAPNTPRILRPVRVVPNAGVAAASTPSHGPTPYLLPTRGLFKNVTCPHYFFEICIYACLALMVPNATTMWWCLLWVAANLTISAAESHAYYVKYKCARKYRIFMYIY
ncbi:3-oxo-5-alpha-steroid 4-dehydrogenase [Allomyces arbusculus]|nr:3-oxo-5-alpha-steroid 4-dehydrogenase [Allomyces arbusculus]